MKKKLVIWGTNAQDEKVLIGIELLSEENSTKIYTVAPENSTTETFNEMMDKWRLDQAYTFPEGTTDISRPLSVTEGLLPDELKVEKGDILLRAQTEWHFVVLSAKLHEAYKSELEDIREKVDKLTEYDGAIWENLKGFWSKVQDQVQEKNLFRDHANTLRNDTNELFSKMKDLRAVLDEEFRTQSKNFKEDFLGLIGGVETKLKENANLNRLFEDLKGIQQKYRDTKFTKDDRNSVWKKLDEAFKAVKEKKYGPDSAPGNSPSDRISSRLNGLLKAIEKMEHSIHRDAEEIKFQGRRVDRTEGQLELQIRQAKMTMLEARLSSKKEKLADMLKTRTELEKKIAKFASRQKKQTEKSDAPKEAENKADKKADKESSEEAKAEEKEEQSGEGIAAALGATLGEAAQDLVDTVKAVADVVSDKVSDAVTEFTEDLKEKQAEAKEEAKKEEQGKEEEE